MLKVKIADLKAHLSEHLRAVEGGQEVEVMDRNRPIARIIPVPEKARIRLIPATTSFRSIRNRRFSPAHWPVSSLDLLLEERQER